MAKRERFQTPAGMRDILPAEQRLWKLFAEYAASVGSSYGFERIDTPIVEFSDLFRKGTGEGTDIVQKEMFSFATKGGDELTLRPEGTPPVIRAYLEHGMEKWTLPVKLFYLGPMFRHEKPQAGRRRQLHQFGVESIGEGDPVRDVQVMQVFFAILSKLKITDVRMELNTIGCSTCRPKYVRALKEYYRNHLKQVCADCRVRYKTNPLRLLDCKDEKCQRVKVSAPQMLDYLCEECRNHFKGVLELLDAVEIPYMLNPHLVRGLDYYTRTVFEIFQGEVSADPLQDAQKRLALAGGGGYDGLVKMLGGKDTPAVGGAMGIERVLAIVAGRSQEEYEYPGRARVFIVQLGGMAKKRALVFMEELRGANIKAGEAFGRESITAQLKVANKMGADLAIILGQKEVLDNVAIIREMDTGSQEIIPMAKLLDEIKKRLKKKSA